VKIFGKGQGQKQPARETKSTPVCAASETEKSPQWHIEGRRRRLWMHDGTEPNGWVEFCTQGILFNSFYTRVHGRWQRQPNQEMLITFGNCEHVVFLLPEDQGEFPMFKLRERVMKNALLARSKNRSGIITRGRLEH